jgi:hypothetical protein
MLHPATLTPANSIQAEDHLTTRMFYASDDLSGFARFPLAPRRNIPPHCRGVPAKALARPRYHLAADASFRCLLKPAVP